MPVQGGGYSVAADLIVNGSSYPWYTISVDLNVYSMASCIEATAPINPFDGVLNPKKVRDFSAEAQATTPYPIQIKVGYQKATQPQPPISMFSLEQGFIDETTDCYDANEISFTGRSTAALFQDARIASANSKNLLGSQLVSNLFGMKGVPVTIGAASPRYVGKAYTEAQYLRTYRARSMWDEMTDAALNDGFILTLHNGQGYYGPPDAGPTLPTVTLGWQRDLRACRVNHAAARSHSISVTVDSYVKATQTKITSTYKSSGTGSAGSSIPGGENFRFFVNGLDNNQLRAKAKAIWLDLVRREFVATLEVVPDAALLKTIATAGPNFLVQLTGVKPSQAAPLYHVKKANVNIAGGDTDAPELLVTLVCANHEPVAGAGSYE